MVRKIGFGLIWLGFVFYAFVLAPPNQPDTPALLQDLLTGQWAGINPLIVALFNLLGIWPMIYSCLIFFDGRGQKIPAWPFAGASFAVGAFALLPYLALRQSQPQFSGPKSLFLKVLDSRWTGVVLTLGAIALIAYGLVAGNWTDFIARWQSDRFIHVTSLDFCLLSLLFPALLGDDMNRRNLHDSRIFWLITLTPLFGPLLYLCWRPPLTQTEAQFSTGAPALSQKD